MICGRCFPVSPREYCGVREGDAICLAPESRVNPVSLHVGKTDCLFPPGNLNMHGLRDSRRLVFCREKWFNQTRIQGEDS